MFQRQWQRKICKVIVGLNVECCWKKTEVSSKVQLRLTILRWPFVGKVLSIKMKTITHLALHGHLKRIFMVSNVADSSDVARASRLASFSHGSRYSIMTTGRFDRCTAPYTKKVYRQTVMFLVKATSPANAPRSVQAGDPRVVYF